jgi:hypothetical protein
VSLPVSVIVVQPATGFRTYAEPWSLFAPMSSTAAPTVSPLIAVV